MSQVMEEQPVAKQTATGAEEESGIRRGRQIGSGGSLRGGSLRQMGGVGMLLRHADEFDLTEEQEERLNQIRTEHELEKIDLLAALQKAKVMFRSLVRNHNSAEQDVMAAIDKVAEREADLRKMRYRHMKTAHSVLNDDQRNSLKSFHKQKTQNKVKAFRQAERGM
jgi:Spy/CpxP family protein refolding chaperone